MNNITEQYANVLEDYAYSRSVDSTARNFGLSSAKVRRILITAGVWENQTSREIADLRQKHPDWDNARISKELHISRQTVSLYTPYKEFEDMASAEKIPTESPISANAEKMLDGHLLREADSPYPAQVPCAIMTAN